jgi:hypothetical protein
MTDGSLFWMIVFAAAALVFFGIAIVVAFRGIGDLRELLGSAGDPRASGSRSVTTAE